MSCVLFCFVFHLSKLQIRPFKKNLYFYSLLEKICLTIVFFPLKINELKTLLKSLKKKKLSRCYFMGVLL